MQHQVKQVEPRRKNKKQHIFQSKTTSITCLMKIDNRSSLSEEKFEIKDKDNCIAIQIKYHYFRVDIISIPVEKMP